MTMFVSSFVARRYLVAVASACVVVASGCSKTPTSPTESGPPVATTPTPAPAPTPAPTPAPPPTPAPNPVGAVTITVNPNPVPQSGVPITDAAGCVGVRYTWYYDQVFRETGGANVTFTNRIDLFDDRETNNTGNLNVVVTALGSNSIRSRWCSSNGGAHTAQTRWTGTDASGRPVTVLGPKVTLAAATP
jgi:hypothetical protein